tara:strand:+ start:339 stop:1193 length:855 start_codon:yes stop_codon:yes gene_type:complete
MIIWIASYPKSGNTWIRSLLASYFFSKDGVFNFNLLKNIEQFTPNISKSILSEESHYQSKVSKSWISTQKKINADKKIRFFKTHNAMCAINGNSFTDKFNTCGVIYIVRDPRNIITSISNHYEIANDKSLEFISNKRKIIFPIKKGTVNDSNENDFNFLSDWGTHYLSWKNISFCPIKIIKYEDLVNNTRKNFLSILDFLSKFIKIEYDDKKIINAIKTTSFEKLSGLEQKKGFDESIISKKTNKKIKFFNLGKQNNWKNLLKKKIISKTEKIFQDQMKELGYL